MPILVTPRTLNILIHIDIFIERILLCRILDLINQEITTSIMILLTYLTFTMILFWSTICDYMPEIIAFKTDFFLWAVLGFVVLRETVEAGWDFWADLSEMSHFIAFKTYNIIFVVAPVILNFGICWLLLLDVVTFRALIDVFIFKDLSLSLHLRTKFLHILNFAN